ncbi:MAG: hypothetical protein AB1461_19070, partial [Thermodesulfobacteriota bacterium]
EQQAGGEMKQQKQGETAGRQQPMAGQQPEQDRAGTEQMVEAILNAEKKLQEMRRQRLRLAPDTVDKDW